MNLSNDIYLRSAFRELDAFAIEGIGTFRKIYHSAREESYSGDIYPPSVEVEFREQVEKELLLEFYLTDSIHLDKQTSVQVVRDIEKGIITSIEAQGYYEIAGIGKLKRGNAGNLYFIPVEAKENVFSSDFYGLQPVQLNQDSDQEDPTTTDTMTSEQNQFDAQSPPPKGYWFGWKAASFLGVILLFGLSLLIFDWPMQAKLKRASLVDGPKFRNLETGPWITDNQDFADANQDDQSQPDSEVRPGQEEDSEGSSSSDETLLNNDFEPIASNNTPVTSESSEPQQTETSRSVSTSPSSSARTSGTTNTGSTNDNQEVTRGISRGTTSTNNNDISTGKNISILSQSNQISRGSQSDTYYVISGSFESNTQAQTSANEMRRKGYRNVTIVQADNKYRVSIYSTTDQALAERYKSDARKNGIKDAWVYNE